MDAYTQEGLAELGRKDLLALVKQHGLKGSGTNEALRERLIEWSTQQAMSRDLPPMVDVQADIDAPSDNSEPIMQPQPDMITKESHPPAQAPPQLPRLTKAAILRAQAIQSKQHNENSNSQQLKTKPCSYTPYSGPIRPWPATKK